MRGFHEVRWIRRGPFAMSVVLALAAVAGGAIFLDVGVVVRTAALVVTGVGLVALTRIRVETSVAEGRVTIRVVPFRRRSFPVTDVVDAEVVVADNLPPIFGGWNAREDWTDAVVHRVERRDRSVGNKAVRFRLASGELVQVGSWKPQALLEAVGRSDIKE